jgi:hypothetical protein
MLDNWHELRMRGKFLRIIPSSDEKDKVQP